MFDRSKEAHLRYREWARGMYEENAAGPPNEETIRQVSAPRHAVVQVTEIGAFVEAVVWVPKEIRTPALCDHKFVDSNVCIKCGWAPSDIGAGF